MLLRFAAAAAACSSPSPHVDRLPLSTFAPPADEAAWEPAIWPQPYSLTKDCSSKAAVSLQGARLGSITVLAGDKAGGAAYVEQAWALAQERDWSNCTGGGADGGRAMVQSARLKLLAGALHASGRLRCRTASCSGPLPPPSRARGAAAGCSVSVTVKDASVDPAAYTAATDESYRLHISGEGGIAIEAASVVGVNWALASLASLAAPAGVEGAAECEIGCLPITGAAVASA